jgi:hypothetical protein
MNLNELKTIFKSFGCTQIYIKELAENDNSKNQIYFGLGFESLNIIPNQGIIPDTKPSRPGFKAKLDFYWIGDNGDAANAPYAQLILYPQYPEVRFSGFLRGCSKAPSSILTVRQRGRLLLLGTTPTRKVYGFAVSPSNNISKEYRLLNLQPDHGVFAILGILPSTFPSDTREQLIKELRRVHNKGWINSKQLSENGKILPCNAPQCGGFTLEAELGIPKNSRSEPDMYGWEIKQHSVTNFERIETGIITLMTPEPTGGFYKDRGVEKFIRTFGYKDKLGRADRYNFGGIYRADNRHSGTHLTLQLDGYNKEKGIITKPEGSITLTTDRNVIAASWDFASLMSHWTRKHAKAAYVPSQRRTEPCRQYAYGGTIRLALHTDFYLFLKALALGIVYYDPGIKLEGASSSKPTTKRRSQFRIASRHIASLYELVETVVL